MKNKKAFELALGWVIAILVGLIILAVIVVFWRALYDALAGLPG